VQPLVADYTQGLLLPRAAGRGPRVGFFPGSTIGNFTPAEAFYFLQVAAQVLRGGALLMGADLVKDPAVLHAAYNDSQGVTARFQPEPAGARQPRARRRLRWTSSGTVRSTSPLQRIEMHLVSRCGTARHAGGERIRVCAR
jgi:hypothetical protein